jgi:hypothetical protein
MILDESCRSPVKGTIAKKLFKFIPLWQRIIKVLEVLI